MGGAVRDCDGASLMTLHGFGGRKQYHMIHLDVINDQNVSRRQFLGLHSWQLPAQPRHLPPCFQNPSTRLARTSK